MKLSVMKRILVLVGVLIITCACQTLEQRLAKKVGCDEKDLSVKNRINAPGYSQYEFICEGKKHTCRDAPFFSNCTPGWHRDTVKGKKK